MFIVIRVNIKNLILKGMKKRNSKKMIFINIRPHFLLLALFAIFNLYAADISATITNSAKEIEQARITVSGKIVDQTNEPLVGATISVKGTNIATMSDVDGNYSINVPDANSTLTFTSVGFIGQEIALGGKTSLNVTLSENARLLDEVVVVGYSTIKKQSLTGALETVDNKKLVDATNPSVENLLQGKATGVYVNSGSGQPGEVGKVIIRGKTTINGNTDPLWVIDGVIVGSGAYNLNPMDVENITVLKDAASTAIYGSQGANGVVIVTTKSGKAGKAVVNVSARMAPTKLNSGNFQIMNGAELYDLYDSFSNKNAFSNAWWWTPELRNKNFDWWDNATQTGLAQDYNISISGGTENLKTYVSLGLYDETGAIKGYDFTRYNVLMKVSYKLFDWLTIKPQIIGSYTDILNKQHSVGAMYLNLPWDSPYREDGSLVGNQPNPTWVNTTGSNYMYDLQWNYSSSDSYEVMGNFDFDVKITDWLTFSSVNNYKFYHRNSMAYTDARSSGGLAVNGRIQDLMSAYNRIYTNQLFKVNKAFGKHAINAVAGYEWNEYNSKSTDQIGTGIAPGFIVADAASVPEKVKGSRAQWAVQSFLSNFNYTYAGKYLAQFSFRRDGASNFGRNNQYGNFFSISGGWNINEEDFFKIDEINSLKLRASYGSVGNRPNSLYPHLTLYTATIGYNEVPGAIFSQIENPDLGWEKTYTTGIGIDAAFLDRFNFTFDYYYKNTSDLLYDVPLPAVTGLSVIWRNVGAVKNKGFEASLGADIIKNRELRWHVDANIGINRNKIVKLYGQKQQIIKGDGSGIAGSASKLLTPGRDADTWYLTEWAGVDPETGKAQWYTTNANGERVKTFSYGEASKHPVASGTYTPDFFGGFSTTLNYKNFDFMAVFNYSVGGKIYNYARAEFDSDGAYTDRNQMKLQDGWSRWEKPGDIATHPQPTYNNSSNSNKASTRFLESGTYLKMRSITLGYTVPMKTAKVSNLRVFVAGENLLTFTKFSGVDPEIPPRDGVITGVATSVYPQTRRFALGLNVTF